MQDSVQLALEGVEPPQVRSGPVRLDMTWRFEPNTQLYTAGWRIVAVEDGTVVEFGDRTFTWSRGSEFAEGSVAIIRIRHARGMLPPF